MPLVLRRHKGESVSIQTSDGLITVTVKQLKASRVELYIDAPKACKIRRNDDEEPKPEPPPP